MKGKNKLKLHLICGFLGAGKTTYAKRLAKEINGVVLNADEECMKLFSKKEYEENWEECFSKTIDILWQRINVLSELNQDIIFDLGFWSKTSRTDAKEKAMLMGIPSILHYVYAPDDILKKRLSLRKGIIAENNLKEFKKLKQLFETPKPDEYDIKIKNY